MVTQEASGTTSVRQQRRTYRVRTYGCQMNVHDSELGLLEAAGYERARQSGTSRCSCPSTPKRALAWPLANVCADEPATQPAPRTRQRSPQLTTGEQANADIAKAPAG